MTRFILAKNNLTTSTTKLFALGRMLKLGWKVKHNKLSELI